MEQEEEGVNKTRKNKTRIEAISQLLISKKEASNLFNEDIERTGGQTAALRCLV
jgi:hypothetical protein